MFQHNERMMDFIRLYPCVSALAGIQALIYFATWMPFFPAVSFYQYFSGTNVAIANGEWWRFISPIFIHRGFSHFFFNTLSLILFAPPLELLLKKIKFLLLYLLSGIFANAATFLLMPLSYTHIGSSGAIFGLFGAFAAFLVIKPSLFAKNHQKIIFPVVLIALLMTFVQTDVNIVSHLTGFACGFLIGSLYRIKLSSD
jgi:membrane associated rhomboid family serine protease